VPVQIHSAGSMFTVFFSGSPIWDLDTAKKADTKRYAKYFRGMLREGVYLPPAQFEAAFVSFAHDKKDLDKTIVAARKALKNL
jgi:glutamate-1-semialdehyde 2,1-aminomutase